MDVVFLAEAHIGFKGVFGLRWGALSVGRMIEYQDRGTTNVAFT